MWVKVKIPMHWGDAKYGSVLSLGCNLPLGSTAAPALVMTNESGRQCHRYAHRAVKIVSGNIAARALVMSRYQYC